MNNKDVVNNIINEFNENINSHVFLIETNDTNKCLQDVKNVIKCIINGGPEVDNQIEEDNYLELILITAENGDIKKDSILDLQKRLNTKPILSKYKFYIISPADALNLNSANKLLKTIEEPEEGIIGFLITSNLDLIINTIKSRCEIQKIMYDDVEQENNEIITEYANSFIKSLDKGSLYDWHKESRKIADLKDIGFDIAKEVKRIYTNACINAQSDIEKNLFKQYQRAVLNKRAEYLNNTLNKLRKNMNGVLLLDLLFIELKKVR